jgi:hypothetical protein
MVDKKFKAKDVVVKAAPAALKEELVTISGEKYRKVGNSLEHVGN